MNLHTLLSARSLAVFGLSRTNPFHPGNVIFTKNRLRYQAHTYGINPNGGTLHRETLYRSLDELPEKPEAAVIAVRAELVPETLRRCIEAGLPGAIVVSGGFAEAGRTDLRDQVVRLCRDHDFPVIGPNCLGAYVPPLYNTFFLPSERLLRPKEGPLSLISQSGGILIELILDLVQENVGVSRAVSIGNKDVVDEVDLLDFYLADPKTAVVGIYVEGFKPGRGRDFAARVAAAAKPVVVLKGGRTPAGSRAAASHTAALAGDYAVFSQVMQQCGAIEAASTREFVSYCAGLAALPRVPGRNVAVVSLSGGHGIVASDACHRAGLNLVGISQQDQAALKERLSPNLRDIASTANPIDLTGSANDGDVYKATEFCLQRDCVDAVILLLLPYIPAITPDIGAHVSLLRREYDKPVLVYIPNIDKYKIYIEGFELNGFPVSHSVDAVMQQARALMGKA